MNSDHAIDEEATAYHEAGHAIVGAVRGRAPVSATILPSGEVRGQTEFPMDWPPEFANHLGDSPAKRHYIETRILTTMSGTLAHDMRFPGRPHDAGDAYDEQLAGQIIRENAGWADDCRDDYFVRLQDDARRLLMENWSWVEAVALALIERKTVSGHEVSELRPIQ